MCVHASALEQMRPSFLGMTGKLSAAGHTVCVFVRFVYVYQGAIAHCASMNRCAYLCIVHVCIPARASWI